MKDISKFTLGFTLARNIARFSLTRGGLAALVWLALTTSLAASTNLVQTARLVASDGQADDHFGASVAISSNIVVVGAPGALKAYAFVRDGTTWSEHKLTLT